MSTLIDLHCNDRHGEYPFKVELLDDAILHLVRDAGDAYRIYELFSIRRPGDIWKYIWVKVIDVPKLTQRRVLDARAAVAPRDDDWHPWPENLIPFTNFDKLFYWSYDDTEPDDECWLTEREREGSIFKEFMLKTFSKVLDSQAQLRQSMDPLINHEIKALSDRQHPYDYRACAPFIHTQPGYIVSKPMRSNGYYEKLAEILSSPDVQCVASRGNDDYQTTRLICAEQRKRANEQKSPPGKALHISILSDGFGPEVGWGSDITFYSEGLGYGDLWVEQCKMGASIKELAEQHQCIQNFVLQYLDEGEIEGYIREIGDGWVFYRAVSPFKWNAQDSRFH